VGHKTTRHFQRSARVPPPAATCTHGPRCPTRPAQAPTYVPTLWRDRLNYKCGQSQLSKLSHRQSTHLSGARNTIILCTDRYSKQQVTTLSKRGQISTQNGGREVHGMPKRFKACSAATSLAAAKRGALDDPISCPSTVMERRSREDVENTTNFTHS